MVCAAFLSKIISLQVMRAVCDMVEIPSLGWDGELTWCWAGPIIPPALKGMLSLANINSGATAAVRRQPSAHLPEPTTSGVFFDFPLLGLLISPFIHSSFLLKKKKKAKTKQDVLFPRFVPNWKPWCPHSFQSKAFPLLPKWCTVHVFTLPASKPQAQALEEFWSLPEVPGNRPALDRIDGLWEQLKTISVCWRSFLWRERSICCFSIWQGREWHIRWQKANTHLNVCKEKT